MSVSLRGQQQWEGFHVLCKAPEVAGLDRRVFGLIFIVFFLLWQGLSFLSGLFMAGVSFVAFRGMARNDPHWFEILRVTARYDLAWADPGEAPARFGPCVVDRMSAGDDVAGEPAVAPGGAPEVASR